MNGRGDLASAIELDLIASALPEQRFFIWRLKAALAGRLELERLRNEQLRHLRRLYPGMSVSGCERRSSANGSAISGASGLAAAALTRSSKAGQVPASKFRPRSSPPPPRPGPAPEASGGIGT
jgi:hypothetical protein